MRYRATSEGQIPFTAEEEAQRDAEEAQAAIDAKAALIPQEVTALQGLLALDASGKADDYEAWANSADRTFSEKAFINKALVWRRNSDTIAAACTALEITDAQRDQLFVLAATL